MDAPNLFGASNRSAPADRSPRPREAEGRLAPEMAESHEARSQAQAQRRAWSQCIATWAASGVAVPRAFFGTFFRFERKYCPPRGGSPTVRAGVGASNPHRQKRACTCGRTKGLSSGQTIGAVRTAVRSACCLPELRVANRLRRLYPLDTRFPSFPFGNLRAPKLARKPWNGSSTSAP